MLKYHGLEYDKYTFEELKKVYKIDKFENVDTSYHKKHGKIGQLKLLMNEIGYIEYLKSEKLNCTPFQVCGGAPGSHYVYLSEMYPDITFILYDLTQFDSRLSKKSNVILRRKYVTIDVATDEFDENGVFVSDMRTLDLQRGKILIESTGTRSLYETMIARDMYDQIMFFYASKCKHGMLKFKIPESMTLSYPRGKIWLQPFINSDEMRIAIDCKSELIEYNGPELDKICNMVNNYWRMSSRVDISEWPRRKQIEQVYETYPKLLKYKTWDMIALVDLLIISNKIKFLPDILVTCKNKFASLYPDMKHV